MESRNFPRQENHLSDGNAAIDLGTSLSESPAPWNGGLAYDAPDGTLTRSGNPGERLVHRPVNMPSEQSNHVEEPTTYITVRRRQTPLENAARFYHLTEEQKETQLRINRANVVREFVQMTDPSLQTLLEKCSLVLNMDVNIERKYIELDIWRVFEANAEKPRFLHLTQGLGILEKYASNLIKENRPPYWRNVKFTSSLIQLHVGRLIGSRDILSQMGYTQDISDGVAFPANVPEPNVVKLKDLATDLFFARFEIDTLLVNKHPFYEMDPPVPQEEVELPRLFQATFPRSYPQRFPPRVSRPPLSTPASTESSVSRPSQPTPTSARNPTPRSPPTPSPRRPGGRSPIPPQEKHKEQATVEEQVSERNAESEGDSEYEDAEDGIDQAQASGGSHTQVSSNADCRICGESIATKLCQECKDTFCVPCDGLYHKHASRQHHVRTQLPTDTGTPSTDRPASSAGATAAPSSPVPQNQRTALSNTATNATNGIRPTPRPRPVPAPRRNIKQPPKTPEPYEEVRQPSIPPKPVTSTPQVQQNTDIHRPPSSAAVAQQPATQTGIRGSNQIQDQTRPILRPPPMPPSFGTTQGSSQGGIDQNDRNYTADEAPPPLPPHKPKTAKLKTPVESRTPISTPPTSSEEDRALSCPYCFFLNSGGNKTCMFCKKPLPEKSDTKPENQSASPQRQGSVDVRNFPSPGLAAQDPARSTDQFHESQASENAMSATRANTFLTDEDSDQNWACEFCTYLNRNRTICEMCFKSRTTPLPPKKTKPVRNLMEKAYPPRTVTNLAMDITSQQITAVTMLTRKPDLPNSPAAPTGSPANWQAPQRGNPMGPPAGPFLGNTIPSGGQPWEAAAFVPGGPPLRSPAPPGVTSPGQGGVLNQTGMVYPGVNPGFPRYPDVLHDPHGFVPPPPFVDQFGATGVAPEINPAAIGNSPLPPPVPTPVDETSRRHQEEIYIAGARYVEWLKAAETEGFTAEEVNIASILGIEDRQGPIHWLQTMWYDLIHRVMVELSEPENSQEIGNVSPEEAREALIECTGEVSRAASKCIENRKKKVKELQQAGVYAKTDCISALDTAEGNTEKAILELEKMALQPMLQRILNSCLPDTATQDDIFRALTRQTDNQSPQDKANFEAIVKDGGQDRDRRIRAILAEKDVSSWGRADIVIKLIDDGFEVEDSLTAARSCRDYRTCLRFLKQECPLCTDERSRTQMITFLHCQHSVCRDCVTQFITITIRDKNIMHLVCPVCGKPENLDDEAVATEYFNNFDIMIRGLVDQETHDLFQRKLRDRTLIKEPNFRWCSHCSSGFIYETPEILKMTCPHCHQYACFKCKRKWEDQHEGITCEQFTAWMEQNDPDFQAAGLAAHLKRNGIVCPNCKFRYDLSKGGCMHFKCAMCSHEFCSGCYNSFIHAERQNCPVSDQCTVRGLHAHHPRDCYFYLRDLEPEELQRLLNDNNVDFNTDPPEGQGNVDEAQAGAAAPLVCKVSEQKETVDGLRDEECGEQVQAGYAGLCKKHYVEYLVVLVNDNLLDPADIMSPEDLGHVLRRGFKETPQKQPRMRENQYQQLLLQTVKDELMLPPKPPRKRILDDAEEVQIAQNAVIDESDEGEEDEDVNFQFFEEEEEEDADVEGF